jgi:hypothetical protein
MWGQSETIAAEDGAFTVELPGALCLQTIADYCMIGGTTYYLVQDNAPARARQLAATRDALATDEAAAMLTASPTATRRVEVTRAPTATPRPSTTPTAATTATATVTPTAAATATVPPTPVPATAPAATETPAPAGRGVADYAGLIAIGLGLLLGVGLFGWRRVGRRGQ